MKRSIFILLIALNLPIAVKATEPNGESTKATEISIGRNSICTIGFQGDISRERLGRDRVFAVEYKDSFTVGVSGINRNFMKLKSNYSNTGEEYILYTKDKIYRINFTIIEYNPNDSRLSIIRMHIGRIGGNGKYNGSFSRGFRFCSDNR